MRSTSGREMPSRLWSLTREAGCGADSGGISNFNEVPSLDNINPSAIHNSIGKTTGRIQTSYQYLSTWGNSQGGNVDVFAALGIFRRGNSRAMNRCGHISSSATCQVKRPSRGDGRAGGRLRRLLALQLKLEFPTVGTDVGLEFRFARVAVARRQCFHGDAALTDVLGI